MPPRDPRRMDPRPETSIDPAGAPIPFELTPGAARVLLRILRKELARREANDADAPDLWNREVLAS